MGWFEGSRADSDMKRNSPCWKNIEKVIRAQLVWNLSVEDIWVTYCSSGLVTVAFSLALRSSHIVWATYRIYLLFFYGELLSDTISVVSVKVNGYTENLILIINWWYCSSKRYQLISTRKFWDVNYLFPLKIACSTITPLDYCVIGKESGDITIWIGTHLITMSVWQMTRNDLSDWVPSMNTGT
jgi:hypothetical protein